MTRRGVAGRIHGAVRQSSQDIFIPLSPCDLVVQSYGEGVSSRRSTVTMVLAHWRAPMTSTGDYTEPVWLEPGAIAPTGADNTFYKVLYRLSTDENERDKIAMAERRLNNGHFALPHTLAALHRVACELQ